MTLETLDADKRVPVEGRPTEAVALAVPIGEYLIGSTGGSSMAGASGLIQDKTSLTDLTQGVGSALPAVLVRASEAAILVVFESSIIAIGAPVALILDVGVASFTYTAVLGVTEQLAVPNCALCGNAVTHNCGLILVPGRIRDRYFGRQILRNLGLSRVSTRCCAVLVGTEAGNVVTVSEEVIQIIRVGSISP